MVVARSSIGKRNERFRYPEVERQASDTQPKWNEAIGYYTIVFLGRVYHVCEDRLGQ
jgi:hypothetical protein